MKDEGKPHGGRVVVLWNSACCKLERRGLSHRQQPATVSRPTVRAGARRWCTLPAMNQHLFDRAIALDSVAPGRCAGRTDAAWANMVGPFGGITAATALNALLLHPDRLGEPVALTVNFCAALAEGAFEVEAQAV